MTNRERLERLARVDPLLHSALFRVRVGACSYAEALEALVVAYAELNAKLHQRAVDCALEHGVPNAIRIADGPPLNREDLGWVPRDAGDVAGD